MTGGSPSASNDGMSLCTRRNTRPTEPRWRIDVHAEAAEARHRVREVGVRRRDEFLGALLRHDRERDALGLDRRYRGEVDPLETAVDTDERRRADLQMNVGRAALEPHRRAVGRDPTRGRTSKASISRLWIGTDRSALKRKPRAGKEIPSPRTSASPLTDPDPARIRPTLARGEDAVDPLPRRGCPGGGMARSTRDRVGRPAVSRRALDRRHRAPAGAIARRRLSRSHHERPRPRRQPPARRLRFRDSWPAAPALARFRGASGPDPAYSPIRFR